MTSPFKIEGPAVISFSGARREVAMSEIEHKSVTIADIEAELFKAGIGRNCLRAAAVLVSAVQVGSTVQALSEFTHYPRPFVAQIVRRAQANRIFTADHRVAGADWFGEDGTLAFLLDVNCALGFMVRTR
jgi:hypothetical protein